MIKVTEFIELNGTRLYVSIRSKRVKAPLLLYLHGGPGDAALPLILKYNKQLEDDFTVVILEQRGAGKSYYPFKKDEKIAIDLFVEDLYELSQYLLRRFEQEKLYLVGHSWGSVLGLKFAKRHPELLYKYIGVGQVVNMKKSSKIALDFAKESCLKSGKDLIAEKLEKIDPAYTQETWLNDLLLVTGEVIKHRGSYYGKTNYNGLIADFILSRHYNLNDLIKRQKGALQAIKYLWPELMMVNFETDLKFNVPVVFIQGRGDYHVSSELVYEYYQNIKSCKEFFWLENSCHFPQWEEADVFNKVIGLLQKKNWQ